MLKTRLRPKGAIDSSPPESAGRETPLAARRAERRRIEPSLHWIAWNLEMTLAAIFVVSIFCTSSPAAAAMHPTATQVAPATQPAESSPAQNLPTPSQIPPSATAPAKTPAGKTSTTTAKSRRHKKRILPPTCGNAPAASGQTSPPAPGDAAPRGATPATSTAVENCPPPKVIVRRGGTTEPSIQLAGGTTDNQTSHQRDTANQMLGATDTNLKKVAGQQLTPNQQDMVNQIHQFMDQSKTATEAGDLERAQNLAWKAKLLSDELVKPEK